MTAKIIKLQKPIKEATCNICYTTIDISDDLDAEDFICPECESAIANPNK